MALQTKPAAQEKNSSKKSGINRVFTLLIGIVCFSLLGYLLVQIIHQFVVPPPAHRLVLVKDIPLPSGLPSPEEETLLAKGTDPNALAPGVQQDFDGFDFQTYDPELHLLFVDHIGPNPDFFPGFVQKRDAPYDGNIIVVDTLRNVIVGRINVPQVAGMVYVPELDKVFAADAQDNYIADINPHTLKVTGTIQLQDNESPDAMVYDPVDKRLFVSDPGTPANPTTPANPKGDNNADRNNENVAVIDAVNDTLIKYINLGNVDLLPGENVRSSDGIPLIADPKNPGKFIPKFGHDVGHDQYYNGFIYVTSQVLPDGNSTDPLLLPPPGTGELFQINATNLTIAGEIDMPASCSTPHGFVIDTAQHTGYIACTDFASSDSGRTLFENLARVDLSDPTNMKPINDDPRKLRLAGGPDIVRIEHNSALNVNVVLVGCKSGVSIFDITPGKFRKLGDEVIGKATHTIAVVDLPDGIYVYLPMTIGGRPVLRVTRYNPNGQSGV
jgi:hypothetical protein